MSTIYGNWEKLVEAVLRRERDRQLALFESFSSSVFSSRPSFDSDFSAEAPSSQSVFRSHTVKAMQFEEIKLSTKNFQPDMLLGEGRLGPVYKGWIHEHFLTAVKPGSGMAVAIRKLNKEGIYYLNRPHHPNLVKLIGHGFEEGNSFLVHEFMPNGSLENHLFTRGHQSLSWQTRIKVACGAARGLSFFHALGIIVIHEGVKTSSILLDDEFNAHLSDFDLARAAAGSSDTYPLSRNHYVAPENIDTGCLTMESDVYSLGIFLLELLSGLRLHDHNQRMKERNLVVWARPFLGNKKKLLQIVDEKLEEYPRDEAYKVGKLASRCLSLDPKLSPRMSEVVDALAQLQCLNTEVKFSSPLLLGPKGDGTDIQMDHAGSTSWNLVGRASGTSSQMFDPADLSSQKIFFSHNVMAIDYEEIKKATNKFHPDMLGEGGFGRLYKGWIHENYLTAVKPGSGIAVSVKKTSHAGLQGQKEWVGEINYLSHLRHPNLVKPIGYSFNKNNRIVVYEFLSGGSLDNHLFTGRYRRPIPWATRIQVAIGAAKALSFLHSLERPVIHRKIRSDDIFLDEDFNPKLSDFGLATDGPHVSAPVMGLATDGSHVSTRVMGFATDGPHVSTRVMGTYGSAEYIATGQLTTRCDVYGFRVINLNQQHTETHNLTDWAKLYLGGKKRLSQIMDSRLEGQYIEKEAHEVAKIASQCVISDPRSRPRMSEVVAALEKL